MAGPLLPGLPLEVQAIIFSYLYEIDVSSYTNALRISRSHNRILLPLLYRCICIRSHVALEGLAATLLGRPELIRYTRSFFFQGPQGRRRTGRDQLRLLFDTDEDEENDDDDGNTDQGGISPSRVPDEELRKTLLEPGIEGEGQEATWDEHESLMHLCTVILRLCSNHLESIGFVDCVPWFLAPAEGGALNFPLPSCRDFTGVTVGLFGLLPHLQRSKATPTKEDLLPTSLQRIHLIGGDFGSFALQRVLVSSPSGSTLTHLHITAPTLYRPEHHSHLVMHIVGLLQDLPSLLRISVGFLHWQPTPPLKGKAKSTPSSDKAIPMTGTGDDSFERGQFKGTTSNPAHSGHGPTDYDDRLTQCRQAYIRALPEALQQSKRENVTVAIIKLPFAEGSPVGFAGWILSHHTMERRDCSAKSSHQDAYRSWMKRDLTTLPREMAMDGAPRQGIWQTQLALEWAVDNDQVRLIKGNDDGIW